MTEIINALLEKESYDLNDLRTVMKILRSEKGCPWDREQDHHSIRSALIEETYEVIEAIDNDDAALLREELGDLLFQIVFHSQIEEEKDAFLLDDVIHDITAKMIHRHPHVFGAVTVKDSGEVLSNWEVIKTEEKQRNSLSQRLKAIPPMLPSLMRASKVCKKSGLYDAVQTDEILRELEAKIAVLRQRSIGDPIKETDVGELLLTIADLSRKEGIDAEEALSKATDRVIERVEASE